MNYHRMLFDSERSDLSVIRDYEMNGYNLTSLWKGDLAQLFPDGLKLYLDDSDRAQLGDLIGNPISWFVCSAKLLNLLQLFETAEGVQLLPAPVYRESDESLVDGYYVLNPTIKIDCLNHERSILSRSASGKIRSLEKSVLISSAIPNGLPVFRLANFPNAIFVREDMAKGLTNKGVTGVAFVRCESF